MAGRRKKSDPLKITLIMAAIMLIVTAAVISVVVLDGEGVTDLSALAAQVGVAMPKKDKLPEESKPAEEIPEELPPPELYDEPDEMRAVTIRAGEDFPLEGSEEDIRAAVKKAVDSIKAMGVMNTVVIETQTRDGAVAYESRAQKSAKGSADALLIALEEAKAGGFYTYMVFHVTDCNTGEMPVVQHIVDAELIDAVEYDIRSFSEKYAPNGILIDSYYNVTDTTAFARYMSLGGADGYEEYVRSIAAALYKTAHDIIREVNPSVRIGLMTEAVWANDYEDERGSATKAYFCTQTEGNADTLSYLDSGLADFIAVKAYGSIIDRNIPFETVAQWWSDIAVERDLPLFIVHAAERAITDKTGWGEYDQIARQVIDAKDLEGYRGSIFNSLDRMLENPSDFAQKLIGYYTGEVLEEHILQDLELTRPSSTKFTTYDPSVSFAGNTDPNTSATINGTPITVDSNGYFQLDMALNEGENVFNIVHKGKTVTYRITKVTEVVKEISPSSGTLTVDGSTKLTITAVAYEEAVVYASINGTTINLTRSEQQDEEYRDTTYAVYTGVYQVPDATTAVQNLGELTVTGTWNGITKSKTGATIKVNEKLLPSDGQPVVVIADLAETFPGNVVSSYSDPTYFPLPKGAVDYALGDEITYRVVENGEYKTYSFYRLQSGLRVLADDIAAVSNASAPSGNKITACKVVSDEDNTKVILNTDQQVSYTATYSASEIEIVFHYTESLPQSMSLSKNPIFSSANFSGDTLTLKLKNNGKFFGYNAWYEDGDLVLCFKNPPPANGDDLDGVSIVIDPGHGSGDTGALGFMSSYPESKINYAIASYLEEILEDCGADVTLIPSNKKYYSLQDRVAAAEDEDPDLFISVHNNSSSNSSSAAGSEAYYFNPWSATFAQYASKELANALNTTNRGGKFGYYYVTRTMQYPAILIEGGFVSNRNEYHKLTDEDYQYEMAQGLAEAIIDYFDSMGAGRVVTGTESTK